MFGDIWNFCIWALSWSNDLELAKCWCELVYVIIVNYGVNYGCMMFNDEIWIQKYCFEGSLGYEWIRVFMIMCDSSELLS